MNKIFLFKNQEYILFLFFITMQLQVASQDFMMQGWYWDFPKESCGASDSWADVLNGKATELGDANFTYVWLPPSSRASFGACSNGYDPQDLYDLGEFGGGPTGLGTRSEVDALIAALDANGINSVADVVFNHRDGGDWETNSAVRDYIINYPNCGGSATPYPINGKVRYILPLGGASGNTAGDYYFKFGSATGNAGFDSRDYKLYFETNTVSWQNMADENEIEPNGGGDCGQPNNDISLGVNKIAVEETTTGCNTDEFHLALSNSDYAAAGDTLYIYMEQINGGGTGIDIRPYGIWSANAAADIIGNLLLQSRTDFTNLPSGQGGMNYLNFKPNGINNTCMTGDIDFPYFFFDIEEDQTSTQTVYADFAEWLWTDVGYRGYRMDAVKHFEPALASSILTHLSNQGIFPEMVVGEFFDSNPTTLTNWVNSVSAPAGVNVKAFDFGLRESLKNASDAFGYDVRNVFNSGMVEAGGATGFQAVTFVNNHDFRNAGEPVQNDPMLGYAYILTNNQVGLPSVFYPDYFGDAIPNAPTVTLKSEINALIDLHRDYIYQSTSVDYLSRFSTPYNNTYTEGFDNTTLLYQLSGGVAGLEVIVAINYAGVPLVLDHGINLANLANGDVLTDMLGNSNEASTTITNGQMHIELPARSYSVWVNTILPLPLTLTDFQVRLSNVTPNLVWKTEAETEVKGFEIERSFDGVDFKNVGFIAGQNKSQNEYLFKDAEVKSGENYYYRLKMIDQDGSFEYSSIRQIRIPLGDKVVDVFPNPFSDIIFIKNKNEMVDLKNVGLYDINGRRVLEFDLEKNQSQVSVKNIQNGIYILKIYDEMGNAVLVQRVVKL
ncbi:MAG: T9SS type A sorting domain-containing protein [Saprospiraceae bacterium]